MKKLDTYPEGKIRILQSGKRVQYFHIIEPNDSKGTYIPATKTKLIHALAQKSYDKKLLAYIDNELKQFKKLKLINPENVCELLSDERRRMIISPFPDDAKFFEEWQAYNYEGKEFFGDNVTEFYTQKNERVRSKSEILIADALKNNNIPYRYECPLKLGKITVYPDFTILNRNTREEFYWEHLGMMDDWEYANSTLKKIDTYESFGIYPGKNLILTHESLENPLSTKRIEDVIDTFLKK